MLKQKVQMGQFNWQGDSSFTYSRKKGGDAVLLLREGVFWGKKILRNKLEQLKTKERCLGMRKGT